MNLVTMMGGFTAASQVLLVLFAYSAVSLVSFAVVYYTTGFDKHFNLPDDVEPSFANCLYYSLATQATCMAGEITPKTPFGRGILSFQITSAYLATLVLLVPWIKRRAV